jgi:competence protein ComEC
MNKILRLPLVPIVLAYTSGIYLGHFDLPFPSRGSILILLGILACWIFFTILKKITLSSWMALLLFFLLGIFSIHSYLHPPIMPSHISHWTGIDRLSLEGTVERPPQYIQERTRLWIHAEQVILQDRHIPVEGRVLIFLKERRRSIAMGDRLRFLCKLYPPHGFHNPGRFSYERYLAFERIHTIGSLQEEKYWVKVGKGFKNPVLLQIERWRDHIRIFLDKETTPPSSGILKALVLGDRFDISEEITEHFIATGIAHLLAISGDHLGIVAFLSFSFLIWMLKRSEFLLLSTSVKMLAAALTIPCILLYTFIAGTGISVIRATLMVITFFLSILFNRERNLLHTLVLAAFLILLFSPPSLFDVSFQLSFLAVLSILYLLPRILRGLKAEMIFPIPKTSWTQKVWRYVKISLLVTGVAILGTAPFVALHFNRISPLGFATNLFFIPWVGFLIVPLSLIASLLSFFFYPLATLLIHLTDSLTAILLKTVAFFASFPYASLFVSTPTLAEIILFYLLLFSVVHLQHQKGMRYLFLGLCIALVFDVAFWNLKDRLQNNLTITFIDVGHGDSILLEFPKGKRMLVDGGGLHDERFDIGKNVIAPLLWKKKIRKIDTLVLTHPDPDHLKGLNFIASNFSIDQFWDNGFQVNSEAYLRLKETLLRKKPVWLSLGQDTLPQTIHGVQISFLNPPSRDESPGKELGPSFLNNHSLVMKIQFKNIVVLLTGDIEKEAEYRMIRKKASLKSDILKIPHHGSSSSSTALFLEEVKPSYAILSVGKRNIGRLPHEEVLRRYEHFGVRVFRTDKHGAITVTTDGKKIQIKTFLSEQP